MSTPMLLSLQHDSENLNKILVIKDFVIEIAYKQLSPTTCSKVAR